MRRSSRLRSQRWLVAGIVYRPAIARVDALDRIGGAARQADQLDIKH
jgi:hypothetical protein